MLAHKAPGLAVTLEGADGLRIGSPWPQFSTLPIGLDSAAVQTVKQNGLLVAPRLVNFTGVTESSIAWEMAQTKRQCSGAQGIGPVIFAGSSVLGNRGLIKATADAIEADGLTYGSVEMGKTFGDEDPLPNGGGPHGPSPQHRDRRDGQHGRADRRGALRPGG